MAKINFKILMAKINLKLFFAQSQHGRSLEAANLCMFIS